MPKYAKPEGKTSIPKVDSGLKLPPISGAAAASTSDCCRERRGGRGGDGGAGRGDSSDIDGHDAGKEEI